MKVTSNSLLAKQICVTGSIGSGKSRVSRVLANKLDLPYIDVDELARKVMSPGGLGLAAIKTYNSAFINDDGSLNRVFLRKEIFNSLSVKKDIDALVHPLIHSLLLERISLKEERAIIEIPLLFETGWDSLFTIIIVVSAEKDICLKRIMSRDQVSRVNAEKAYSSQMEPKRKKAKATFVIENDGDWQTTMATIQIVVDDIRNNFTTV